MPAPAPAPAPAPIDGIDTEGGKRCGYRCARMTCKNDAFGELWARKESAVWTLWKDAVQGESIDL